MVERHSYKVDVDGSIPSGRTIWEIAKSFGAALATPPPDASAAPNDFAISQMVPVFGKIRTHLKENC